jgi:hypothetical protein
MKTFLVICVATCVLLVVGPLVGWLRRKNSTYLIPKDNDCCDGNGRHCDRPVR